MHAIQRAAHAAVRSELSAAAISALRRLRIESAAPQDRHEAENLAPDAVMREIDRALADPEFRKRLADALGVASISGGRP